MPDDNGYLTGDEITKMLEDEGGGDPYDANQGYDNPNPGPSGSIVSDGVATEKPAAAKPKGGEEWDRQANLKKLLEMVYGYKPDVSTMRKNSQLQGSVDMNQALKAMMGNYSGNLGLQKRQAIMKAAIPVMRQNAQRDMGLSQYQDQMRRWQLQQLLQTMGFTDRSNQGWWDRQFAVDSFNKNYKLRKEALDQNEPGFWDYASTAAGIIPGVSEGTKLLKQIFG